MSTAPSVLLLDDGELDRVHRMLKQLGVDCVRLQKGQIRSAVPKPRDLLISSRDRTLEMPRLESSQNVPLDPVWVCVHNQDFLPLRQRLRELGVHFLVHTALDQESLRLFLLQLLNRGLNRRQQLRLPLGDSIQCGAVDAELEPATLADLTADMCRVVAARAAEPGTVIRIVLPEALGGGERLELQGGVVRSAECESRSGESMYSILVRLDGLDPEARAQVDKLVRGERIGTRVTPLAERSPDEPAPIAAELREEAQEPQAKAETAPRDERRRHPRWEYGRSVGILDFEASDGTQTALGHDLSLEGVRIVDHSGPEVGSEVTLALYGGSREEPVVIEATVLRDDGEEGLALVFKSISDSQRRELERILAGRPPLESLRDGARDRDAVVVAQVTPAQH
jgi:hypothetical protein